MKRLLKWGLGFIVVNTVIWAVGRLLVRSRSTSDMESDELELYSFWSGDEFVSRASALRRVKARIFMAGASIDLRDAEVSSDGLTIDVSTVMGGVAVLVRKDWQVDVVEHTRAAEVEIDLDQGVEVGADQPRVTVLLRTTMGGALVGYELPADRNI